MSVTVGVASSVANDVTVTIAGLWRYGDWRHVATGCTAVVNLKAKSAFLDVEATLVGRPHPCIVCAIVRPYV